jgi:hypothetical protein
VRSTSAQTSCWIYLQLVEATRRVLEQARQAIIDTIAVAARVPCTQHEEASTKAERGGSHHALLRHRATAATNQSTTQKTSSQPVPDSELPKEVAELMCRAAGLQAQFDAHQQEMGRVLVGTAWTDCGSVHS